MMIEHIQEIVETTDIPVNADYENGYADDPGEVAENVRRCVNTGVAGLSIEDSTGRKEQPLYDVDVAVERIRAARGAIGDSGALLVARAECFLVGITNIDEADCLYAPGIRDRDHIAAVVAAVAPKPVNLLIGGAVGLTMSDAAALGVRRVSVGGALARAAWGGFMLAAKQLAEDGRFNGFADAAPHSELQEFFRDGTKRDKR